MDRLSAYASVVITRVVPAATAESREIYFDQPLDRGLGIVLMLIGIVCLCLNGALVNGRAVSSYLELNGICAGLVYLAVGLLKLLSGIRSPTRCLIIFVELAFFVAIIGTPALFIAGIINISLWKPDYGQGTSETTYGLAITLVILIGIAGLIVAEFYIQYCSNCCCWSQPTVPAAPAPNVIQNISVVCNSSAPMTYCPGIVASPDQVPSHLSYSRGNFVPSYAGQRDMQDYSSYRNPPPYAP